MPGSLVFTKHSAAMQCTDQVSYSIETRSLTPSSSNVQAVVSSQPRKVVPPCGLVLSHRLA